MPPVITACSAVVTRSASFVARTCLGRELTSSISRPLRLVSWTSGVAQWRTPRAASVAYAFVISSGFTASTPSVMEQTGSSALRMPSRCAMSTTFWGPSCADTCANTVFTECAVAESRLNVPASESEAFDSCQGSPFV